MTIHMLLPSWKCRPAKSSNTDYIEVKLVVPRTHFANTYQYQPRPLVSSPPCVFMLRIKVNSVTWPRWIWSAHCKVFDKTVSHTDGYLDGYTYLEGINEYLHFTLCRYEIMVWFYGLSILRCSSQFPDHSDPINCFIMDTVILWG